MLSELHYGAFLVYSVRGTTEASRQTKTLATVYLKQNRLLEGRPTSELLTAWMRASLEPDAELLDFLDPQAALVPLPRSSPLKAKDWLWPAAELAEALRLHGFGDRVVPALKRTEAVPKSAFAAPAERPTARRHFETLDFRLPLGEPALRSVTLVDDIVTRGATMIGAASRVAEACPEATIRGFAIFRARSRGEVDPYDSMIRPCVDKIVLYSSGKTFRLPE